ncbi:MAG: flagellar basal body L-ring protein FlgH [Rhodobacteraceae bacterium]|nr:flagellar basal body L-ring protein FlgH [Paracoccaceae bacterium]
MRLALVFALALVAAGCGRLAEVGRAPEFQPMEGTTPYSAMYALPMPEVTPSRLVSGGASLWSASQQSLLGDRRAQKRGDILTVVIEIDDSARISNASERSRAGSESVGIPSFLGLPQRLDRRLPEGATLADAIETDSSSRYAGEGSVARAEQLTLRIAATVVEVLPNGVLRISGTQEVRVNFELRDLVVDGFVRAQDISRRNEVPYDKIAGARIAYGGRGQISDVQQPRYGQQITDILSPF